MSYYEPIANPLYEALKAITGKRPPPWTKGLYSGHRLGERVAELQNWCSVNANPYWSTGLGVLEAAELIVKEAVDNGNIVPEEHWKKKS